MGRKITINLEDRSFEFLSKETNNRSAYINQLILEKKKEQFEAELSEAYREQNDDPEFRAAIEDWDCTVGDGIPDEV